MEKYISARKRDARRPKGYKGRSDQFNAARFEKPGHDKPERKQDTLTKIFQQRACV